MEWNKYHTVSWERRCLELWSSRVSMSQTGKIEVGSERFLVAEENIAVVEEILLKVISMFAIFRVEVSRVR